MFMSLHHCCCCCTCCCCAAEPAGSSPEPYLQPSAMRAVRHGLTSSFGSVCFSGLILMIIEMLRKAMNNAQNNAEVRCSSSEASLLA